MPGLHTVAFAAFLALAAAMDLWQRRVPNRLLAPFAGVAALLAAAGSSPVGLGAAAAGGALGLALLLLPFGVGAVGAGDVKFLAGVGVFLGPRLTLWAFLLGSLWGALAVVPARWRRSENGVGIPYAVPLALGAGTALVLDHAGCVWP